MQAKLLESYVKKFGWPSDPLIFHEDGGIYAGCTRNRGDPHRQGVTTKTSSPQIFVKSETGFVVKVEPVLRVRLDW